MIDPLRLVRSFLLLFLIIGSMPNLDAAPAEVKNAPRADGFQSSMVFPVYLGTNLSSFREEELSGALRRGRFAAVYHSGKKILEQRSSAPIAGMVGVAAAA